MKIAIVDDEKYWRNLAAKIISTYYRNADIRIYAYASGQGLLQRNMRYDIVFLDVEMHNLDGFETAEKYQKIYPDCIIIMFTMHTELSRKGYLVNAFRYIDKNNMSKEIQEALDSADKLLEQNRRIEFNVVNVGSIWITLKDILYIETEKRNIKVHTRIEDIICSDNINDIDEKVAVLGFYRCHISYIVNLDAVERFDHTYIYMIDGSKAMVSTRKYVELRRKLLERKFEQANS